MKKTPIIKRKGHTEHYDERKVYASCYAAALNAHYSEPEAERLAAQVTKKVSNWVKKKDAVSSDDIKHEIIMHIPDPAVALLYKHHRDLC